VKPKREASATERTAPRLSRSKTRGAVIPACETTKLRGFSGSAGRRGRPFRNGGSGDSARTDSRPLRDEHLELAADQAKGGRSGVRDAIGVGNIASVGPAAVATGKDRRHVLSRLASARGYTVFDRRRRRVGTFIELAGASGEGIAIRHDGVLFWRRRVLPFAMVAAVLPEHGAVVLNVDRRTLKDTDAAPTPVDSTPSAGESDGDASGSAESTAHGHLLFVSLSHGYELLERQGPPPAALEYVSVPGHDVLFRVAKRATSPLPNDRRVCAYIEQTE
jgi:hypothetical protein